MGYEIKLYLGEVADTSSLSYYDGRHSLMEVATIDLCKTFFGYETPLAEITEGGIPVYIYGLDGNDTATTEDRYGESLVAVDPAKLLARIKKANKGEKYRRYDMAISLLESFIAAGFHNPGVVCFGH